MAPSRVIDEATKQELLKWKKENLTIDLIIKTFGVTTKLDADKKFVKTEPQIRQNAKMHLNAGEYINKQAIDTNVGIFLFNKMLIEGRFEHIIENGYYNEVITAKKFDALMGIISSALMRGDVHINPEVSGFLRDYEFYSLKLSSVFSPSYTLNSIRPIPSIRKEIQKKVKESPPETIQDMVKLEEDAVNLARDKLQDDPAMTLFASGSRGSFENDYKTMSVAIGPVANPVTGKYDFVDTCYIDGFGKKDLVAAGNIIVNSEFPKAVGTRSGGYLTKQFYAVYQSIVIGEKDSDCGTDQCYETVLTPQNVQGFLYQYIRHPSGKLELLTEENMKDYMNKVVHFRSPLFCLSDKLCNMCVGERFTKIDMQNIGLTSVIISGNMLNSSMKKRHSMKIKMNEIDPETLLL